MPTSLPNVELNFAVSCARFAAENITAGTARECIPCMVRSALGVAYYGLQVAVNHDSSDGPIYGGAEHDEFASALEDLILAIKPDAQFAMGASGPLRSWLLLTALQSLFDWLEEQGIITPNIASIIEFIQNLIS